MAFLWEKCGGAAYATTQKERILSRSFPHNDVHERCGIIMLGPEEKLEFDRLLANLKPWAGMTTAFSLYLHLSSMHDFRWH